MIASGGGGGRFAPYNVAVACFFVFISFSFSIVRVRGAIFRLRSPSPSLRAPALGSLHGIVSGFSVFVCSVDFSFFFFWKNGNEYVQPFS